MSISKHTPRPWVMDGPTLKGNGYNIGSVNSHRTTEGSANARLIAAAPELLEALQSVMDWTAEENIPADRVLLLIRNAARVAIDCRMPDLPFTLTVMSSIALSATHAAGASFSSMGSLL